MIIIEMIIIISSSTIIGYLFNVEWLYMWVGQTAMALNTAVTLLLCGFALYIIAKVKYDDLT